MAYRVGWTPIMPRRNANAERGGRAHTRGKGAGWMKGKARRTKKGTAAPDNAPLTPGSMHSKTRIR